MTEARLQRVIAVLKKHADASLHSWFAAADSERRSSDMTFEDALGLTGPRALSERDEALAAAAEAMDPKGQLSRNARAVRLAARLETFERIVWPRYSNDPTADTHGVNHHLLRAWRTGLSIPRSDRTLNEILKNHSADFKKAG